MFSLGWGTLLATDPIVEKNASEISEGALLTDALNQPDIQIYETSHVPG